MDNSLFMHLLSNMGFNAKYCSSVFITGIICSWYGVDGYKDDNYIKELANCTILILPVHILITFLIMWMLNIKFRRYIVQEKGFKTDKDGNIIVWHKIYNQFNKIATNQAINLSTYIIISSTYIISIFEYLRIIEYDKSVSNYLCCIIGCSFLFVFIISFFSGNAMICIIYHKINDTMRD